MICLFSTTPLRVELVASISCAVPSTVIDSVTWPSSSSMSQSGLLLRRDREGLQDVAPESLAFGGDAVFARRQRRHNIEAGLVRGGLERHVALDVGHFQGYAGNHCSRRV